jgi:hypothetical protein
LYLISFFINFLIKFSLAPISYLKLLPLAFYLYGNKRAETNTEIMHGESKITIAMPTKKIATLGK